MCSLVLIVYLGCTTAVFGLDIGGASAAHMLYVGGT